MRVILLAVVVASIASCAPRSLQVTNRFDDPVLRHIATLQDKRDGDSLATFFRATNANHRAATVRAFGSVQDSSFISTIAKLAVDTSKSVREAVAFALAQTPSQASLSATLANHTSSSQFLVALGRTATSAKTLADVIPADPVEFSDAHAWMLYGYSLRHPFDSVPDMLPKIALRNDRPVETKIAVTQFLARGVKHNDLFKNELIQRLREDSSAEVRMNAAFALRRIRHDDVRLLLQDVSVKDSDDRVRINALRSLQAFPSTIVIGQLLESLKDSVTNVAIAASEIIETIADTSIISSITPIIADVPNWRVRANLVSAKAKAGYSPEMRALILGMIDAAGSVYEKAALIHALQYDTSNYTLLIRWVQGEENSHVIRSTAAMTLIQLLRKRELRSTGVPAEVAKSIVSIISQGDPAVVGILSEAIADTTLQFRKHYDDATFLRDARAKLSLPRDIEAIQPLEKAIAVLENSVPSVTMENPFNHPIDWLLVGKIRSGQKMVIETNRGDIVISLFVDEAPGSAGNFVALADRGYFNGKSIHRVVPNFVVQAGCHRGDGWGSEDYSIRSEFTPRKFITGSVGMASAGKDTEGTQWFITHSPAPHLDGRYTNFAQVVSGMDVVHKLEVGDTILSVRRY